MRIIPILFLSLVTCFLGSSQILKNKIPNNLDNKDQIMSALSEAKDGKIIILIIHGIPYLEHSWVSITPELFKEYLQYLSEHNFKVIALRDLNNYINVTEALETIVPDLNKNLSN